MKPPSKRAIEILAMIEERCKDGCFWVPQYMPYGIRVERLGRSDVSMASGSGDAAVIKSLWKRGLAERVTSPTCTLPAYSSRISDAGKALLDKVLQ
jgi:hypothetical protein